MARVRVLGERLGAEKITLKENWLSIDFPEPQGNGRDVKELLRNIADYPVEISAIDRLGIRLPLPETHGEENNTDYLIQFLRVIAKEPEDV
jgi:hypothetical protein